MPPFRTNALTTLPTWQPPPTSLSRHKALTRALATAPSYTVLHGLLTEHAPDFNAHHAVAALTRTLALHRRGLSPREARQFKEGCSMIQTVLRRLVPAGDLSPRALVSSAHALARLELHDRDLLTALAAAAEPHLPGLTAQGLATLLWAFARADHPPPPRWMDAYMGCVAAGLPAFAPRDLSQLLWALSKLHFKVAPARLHALLAHARGRLHEFCGRSLGTCVLALAAGRAAPGREWLAAAQAQAVALGPGEFTPQDMTQLAASLAKLGCPPSPAFLLLMQVHVAARLLPYAEQRRLAKQLGREAGLGAVAGLALWAGAAGGAQGQEGLQEEGQLEGASQAMLLAAWQQRQLGQHGHPERQQQQADTAAQEAAQEAAEPAVVLLSRRPAPYNGLDLCTLLYALGAWGARPHPKLARNLVRALRSHLPALAPNQLCNALWAAARLGLALEPRWLAAFFDASFRQLPAFKPGDLAQSLWALARLRAVPPAAWRAAALTQLQHAAPMFAPVEVATTLWALAALGVRNEELPGEALALLFVATDRRLSGFKPEELCSMAWALARMRRRPDKEWAAEFLKVTYIKLPSMSGRCLGTLAWSLAEMRMSPPPAWLYAFVNAARALLQQQALDAGAAPPAAASPAGGLSALDLAQVITSLRRLNEGSGLAKVDDFVVEAEGALGSMERAGGAFAAQQVGAFLGLTRRQAGLQWAGPEQEEGLEEEEGEAAAAAVYREVEERQEQGRGSGRRSGRVQEEEAGAATRVLEGGVTLTLLRPAPRVQLELGELALGLVGEAPAGAANGGAAYGDSSSSNGSGNGVGGEHGGDGGAGSSLEAEVRRRLLAAAGAA